MPGANEQLTTDLRAAAGLLEQCGWRPASADGAGLTVLEAFRAAADGDEDRVRAMVAAFSGDAEPPADHDWTAHEVAAQVRRTAYILMSPAPDPSFFTQG